MKKNKKICDIKIAAIMDEFTFDNFSLECEIVNLDIDNFRLEIDSFKPDLLFIESVWKGKNGQWESKVRNKCSSELRTLTDYARNNKIPSIFWNKEDPVHYSAYINAARLCDYVFTSDVDCISMYKADLPHNRVFFLPFACQPKIQNPIERSEGRKPGFCFAGAAYKRFPERMENMENIFDAITEYAPLTIYNRFYAYNYPRYKFPEKYDKHIKPNLKFTEIDKAYKGYEYAINLNSVKMSQSMSARRVYELMASGTPIVSNYSRALKNFFGDLIFMSDNGSEIMDKINRTDRLTINKIKTAALRKVLMQHTFEERLRYIAKISLNMDIEDDTPTAVCIAYADYKDNIYATINMWQNQKYKNKKLLLITNKSLLPIRHKFEFQDILFADYERIKDNNVCDFLSPDSWLFLFHDKDWYGPNYLLDTMLALKYSSFPIYGKGEFYSYTGKDMEIKNPGACYKLISDIPLRRCAISREILDESLTFENLSELICSNFTYPGMALDALSYCENASKSIEIENILEIDPNFDCGINIKEINDQFLSVNAANKIVRDRPRHFVKDNLLKLFESNIPKDVKCDLGKDKFYIKIMSGENPDILYSDLIKVDKYQVKNYIPLYIDSWHDNGYLIRFLNIKKEIISENTLIESLRNYSINIPANSYYFQLGIKTNPNNDSILNSVDFMHRFIFMGSFISNNKYIIITSSYPDYNDLYKNAFLHTRIKSYKDHGIEVDLFIISPGAVISYREYQGIHAISGDIKYLRQILSSRQYNAIIVHFLYKPVWNLIKNYSDTRKIIWVHGSEIQPYHRRLFNYTDEEELTQAIRKSESRMAYWKDIFNSIDENLQFVFVSRYFANEVLQDYEIDLPEKNYHIIYNPVNIKTFPYYEHPVEHRYNIISIRTFFSNKYANDLVVKCVLKLSERPDFERFNILIAGDGVLFDETVEPLRVFGNVKLEKRFYTHQEMANLYKYYGINLVPTRWDSQGVSRDEAMACGLVPVTNAVAAIPEFVNDQCAIIAPPEDWDAMAEGIGKLVDNPKLFLEMSKAAFENVTANRTTDIIINQELELVTNDKFYQLTHSTKL